MKKISQLLITALSLALVACGTLGGGDTDMSNDPSFKQLKEANVNFWKAREHAALCVGNNEEANKARESAQAAQSAKNPSDIQSDKSKEDSKNSFEKNSKIASEEAKKEFETSAVYFFKGLASETKLASILTKRVQELQASIQSASPMEKMKLSKQLSPLTTMLDIVQRDIRNAAGTIDAYTVYATKNGIDIASLRAKAEKEAEKEAEKD